MKYLHVLGCAIALTGCGSDGQTVDAPIADARVIDASLDAPIDAPIDATPDAPPDAPCEHQLLVGGMDIAAQGWTVVAQGPHMLSYGADYTELQTSTTMGQTTGGQQLLTYGGAVTAGEPFALEVVMLVQAVNPHNPLDSGAAIMGSFTPPFGTTQERSEMIYLDAAKLGWADDTASYAVTVTDGAYHTYVLAVDAAGAAQLTIDGTPALTRAAYTTNGTIAIGDQSNEKTVDSTLRIRSVRLLCP